ncbi:BPL-N domain-containing protein [Nocardia sp. CDC159]|uniref:BPL-N domain-containing protein n=1 Tax=Nocardia pulmonis TaxID=2951408 RepID=A0A9X2E1X6_9NOCA|nr:MULTISPECIES: BPL-N domain-containing protein [Nocardia]MCM6772709.1 BPL-N domain-containing protein [Nocardia pulmonis]MCM6785988.1 BPL-N domain-containing protein [Nocardia sp. CDC159]
MRHALQSRLARPVALVYRGPASLPGCSEAVAELLAASRWNFDIHFTGPGERVPLSQASLTRAALYAQPGGDELDEAYRQLREHREAIRRFVGAGGRYLGFCLGGYLAGATPGFALLPGDTDRYIDTRRATVRTAGNAVVEVSWRGRPRRLFFQDGPHFALETEEGATVLAIYDNHTVAAAVTPFGSGRVGVVGPHPEATPDWFTDAGLPRPHGPDPQLACGRDLALDLVNAVMT